MACVVFDRCWPAVPFAGALSMVSSSPPHRCAAQSFRSKDDRETHRSGPLLAPHPNHATRVAGQMARSTLMWPRSINADAIADAAQPGNRSATRGIERRRVLRVYCVCLRNLPRENSSQVRVECRISVLALCAHFVVFNGFDSPFAKYPITANVRTAALTFACVDYIGWRVANQSIRIVCARLGLLRTPSWLHDLTSDRFMRMRS